VPNAALLGGFAALTGLITLEAVAHAIRHRFAGAVAEANVAAAADAYEHLMRAKEAQHAAAN
jgi:pyruvate ferredoxin oxidoreductase gamma subunit